MKLTPFSFNGTTYYLLLNGAAMFDIYDQFGQEGSIIDHIKGNDRDAFEAICWYLEELSAQGELFRRKQGFDKGPILSADTLMVDLGPMDVLDARAAVKTAIYRGFTQDVEPPPGTVDLFQAEWEKKTGESSPAPTT